MTHEPHNTPDNPWHEADNTPALREARAWLGKNADKADHGEIVAMLAAAAFAIDGTPMLEHPPEFDDTCKLVIPEAKRLPTYTYFIRTPHAATLIANIHTEEHKVPCDHNSRYLLSANVGKELAWRYIAEHLHIECLAPLDEKEKIELGRHFLTVQKKLHAATACTEFRACADTIVAAHAYAERTLELGRKKARALADVDKHAELLPKRPNAETPDGEYTPF